MVERQKTKKPGIINKKKPHLKWGFLLAYISPNFRRFTHFRKSISYR